MNTTQFKDFKDYLAKEICDYEGVVDFVMKHPYFENWLENQDIDVLMMYADSYAKLRADYAYTEGVKAGIKTEESLNK